MAKTKYRKVYCNKVIAFMSLGKSFNQFAHSIDVVTGTINTWRKTHPDFETASQRAEQASLAYWEDKLEEFILDKDVNTQLVKLLFAHRFKWYSCRPVESNQNTIDIPKVNITVSPGSENTFTLNDEQKPNCSVH